MYRITRTVSATLHTHFYHTPTPYTQPEGCAALTGEGLKVGQQILSVGGQCLFNLRHKEVVMAVKSAFEGPLQKTLELVLLDQA